MEICDNNVMPQGPQVPLGSIPRHTGHHLFGLYVFSIQKEEKLWVACLCFLMNQASMRLIIKSLLV